MVSIKSLAVILFAVVVAAAPPPTKDGHGTKGHGNNDLGNNLNLEDNSKKCGEQNQEMFCCNDYAHSKATDTHTGVLEGTNVKCNLVPASVLAVPVLSGPSVCNGKAACCTNESDENGVFNIAAGCIALPGAN